MAMLLPGWGNTAAAQTPILYSGNELLNYCQSPSQTAAWGFCQGYVASMIDTEGFDTFALSLRPVFCIPTGVTIKQLADIAIKYLVENPDRRHFGAASLIWGAMRDAFPCPKTP